MALSEWTQFMKAIEEGDPTARDRLFPLVYDELRRIAGAQLANERPGHTLQPTTLVHEAYLRLFGSDNTASRGTAADIFLQLPLLRSDES